MSDFAVTDIFITPGVAATAKTTIKLSVLEQFPLQIPYTAKKIPNIRNKLTV